MLKKKTQTLAERMRARRMREEDDLTTDEVLDNTVDSDDDHDIYVDKDAFADEDFTIEDITGDDSSDDYDDIYVGDYDSEDSFEDEDGDIDSEENELNENNPNCDKYTGLNYYKCERGELEEELLDEHCNGNSNNKDGDFDPEDCQEEVALERRISRNRKRLEQLRRNRLKRSSMLSEEGEDLVDMTDEEEVHNDEEILNTTPVEDMDSTDDMLSNDEEIISAEDDSIGDDILDSEEDSEDFGDVVGSDDEEVSVEDEEDDVEEVVRTVESY